MVIFSPSNQWNPAGQATLRKACEREYCYCVPDIDCELATIPAGNTEELRDVGTNEVIVRTGQTTSGITLYADVNNPWNFNEGVRAVFNISAFSVSVTLTADAQSGNDSESISGTNPRITAAALCVDENGLVTAWATAATDTTTYIVFAQLAGYDMGNGRNWAGVSGSSYAETTIEQIQTTARPECDPCPDPPPEFDICTICGPNNNDKPANLRVTISGFAGNDPDNPCHPDSVCGQLNGAFVLPNIGFTNPCCYRLDFDIPANTCLWFSDCPDGLNWYVQGFCIEACIVENTAIPPDRYRVDVRVGAYGIRQDPPNTPFSCFTEHCNELNHWDMYWQGTNWLDPLVTPCTSINELIPDMQFGAEGGTFYWISDNLIDQWKCRSYTGAPVSALVEAA